MGRSSSVLKCCDFIMYMNKDKIYICMTVICQGTLEGSTISFLVYLDFLFSLALALLKMRDKTDIRDIKTTLVEDYCTGRYPADDPDYD